MAQEIDVKYPIGQYEPQPYSNELRLRRIADIRFLPNDLEMAIQHFDAYQLDTPYREGGWTVKQLVHHVADSHMNAYIRFKLAVTENNVTIRPYDEKLWANLPDVATVPVNVSVTLLFALHQRWVVLLESLPETQLLHTSVLHPEHQKHITLWDLLGMYAWHGRHHVEHIKQLTKQKGWQV